MRNFTFLFFLAMMAFKGHGQCIRTYSPGPIASNNMGLVQQLSSCGWTTTDVVSVSNLLAGEDYVFTCTLGSTNKYITVTDADNVVIEQGFSPLTVSAINVTTAKLHLSDDDSCAGTQSCHIVTAQIILDCPVPVAAVIDELGTTTAYFTWEAVGSETSWEVIALPAASPAPANDLEAGVSTVNDNPEFNATLLPATTYKFYYRAVCAADEKSPWNSTAAFTTLCEEVTYFSEGFDSSTTLPICFSKIGAQGNAGVQSDNAAASSPNVLYMASGGILSLPVVSNFAEATHRIKFKVRSIYTVGGSVEFGYLLDPLDGTSFVALETFATSSLTQFSEYTFEPDGNTQNGNFAFRHMAAGNMSIVLDDIIWEPIPACDDVTSFKIDTFTSTAATLSWTSEDSSFEVVYGVAATTADPNGLTPQTVEDASVALSDLQANTAYKVWVRSNCGNNAYGAWIGPKTVTTTCAPVTTFIENFDASTNIPACLKRVGSGGNAYVQYTSSAPSAPNSFTISSYLSGDVMSYGILSLPPVSNAAAGTHRMKFRAKSSGSIGGIVEFGYLTNPGDGTSFVGVQSFTSTSSSAFETFIYIPQAGAIQAEVFAFRHTGVPSSAVQIDDIVWETAPNCGDVMAIQASQISNASAKISWTGNSETNWEVAYGAATVTDPNTLTPIAVSDVSNTILNTLNASTVYKVWVRSNCGTAGFGAWIGPVQFTTSCNPVSEFSEGFNASTSVPGCWTALGGFIMTNSPNDNLFYMTSLNVLATPNVSNASAGTHRLKFKAKAMYGLGGTVQVGYMTSYNTAATFVPLQSYTPTSTTVFEEFYANLGTVPTTGYLAIRHSGTSFNAVAVDDIVWEALPTCEDVSDLVDDFIGTTTATVSWTAEYSTAWEVAYAVGDDETEPSGLPFETATATTFTFLDLESNAAYKFWVRAVCENGEYGAWIGPKMFKTNCDPVTDLPWIEDFESATLPNLPECWTEGNGNWEFTDAESISIPNSGDQYIRVYNNVTDGYMWTPGFELQANISYDFSTFVQGDGYDGWSVAMMYNTNPKAQGAVQFGELYEVAAGTGMQPYEEMRRAFVPTVSGTYYFAVKVNENSTAAPYYLAFDDFSVETTTLGNPSFGTGKFMAYPNPVKNILNVSYTANIDDVAIFNLLGQQVMAKGINAANGQIDMSDLAAGSYLVKITADNQVQTLKIVKQ